MMSQGFDAKIQELASSIRRLNDAQFMRVVGDFRLARLDSKDVIQGCRQVWLDFLDRYRPALENVPEREAQHRLLEKGERSEVFDVCSVLTLLRVLPAAQQHIAVRRLILAYILDVQPSWDFVEYYFSPSEDGPYFGPEGQPVRKLVEEELEKMFQERPLKIPLSREISRAVYGIGQRLLSAIATELVTNSGLYPGDLVGLLIEYALDPDGARGGLGQALLRDDNLHYTVYRGLFVITSEEGVWQLQPKETVWQIIGLDRLGRNRFAMPEYSFRMPASFHQDAGRRLQRTMLDVATECVQSEHRGDMELKRLATDRRVKTRERRERLLEIAQSFEPDEAYDPPMLTSLWPQELPVHLLAFVDNVFARGAGANRLPEDSEIPNLLNRAEEVIDALSGPSADYVRRSLSSLSLRAGLGMLELSRADRDRIVAQEHYFQQTRDLTSWPRLERRLREHLKEDVSREVWNVVERSKTAEEETVR